MTVYRLTYFLWRLIDAYELLIIVNVFMSWIPRSYGSTIDQIHNALRGIVDPFLNIFRRVLTTFGGSGMSLDFSPVVAILVLDLVKRLL